MGRLKELCLMIEEDLLAGDSTYEQIAKRYGVTYEDVLAVARRLEEEFGSTFDDSMDGDFDSGMASAGFGTDEDYGFYGDE